MKAARRAARALRWVVILAAAAQPAAALAQLRPGDIAVVGYNTDGVDDFAWVALRDIPSNTAIRFTDSSVSNGLFRWTEHLGDLWPGPLTWSHTNTVRAGTVIRWMAGGATNWSLGAHSGGSPRFSSDGDQIFAYTGCIASNTALPYPWWGDPTNATMIFGINFANGGWNNIAGGDPTTSFVPPGLCVRECTAVYTDSHDDGYYRGACTGTAARLLQAIADPANWRTANDPFGQTNWPSSFQVLPVFRGVVFSVK